MALHNSVILDLTGLETGSLAGAGRAVAQVQMCLTRGRTVIAVVNASRTRAARDLAEANRLGATAEPVDRAGIITAGATDAAGIFTAVLNEAAISAVEADRALLPVARGHALDAEPRHVSGRAYRQALGKAEVLVVPGGVGIDEEGRPASFGANTATLTALFLGDRLGLPVERPEQSDLGGDDESAPSNNGVGPNDIGARKAARFSERHGVTSRAVGMADRTPAPEPARVAAFGNGPVATLLEGWAHSLRDGFILRRFPATALGAEAARAWSPDVIVDFSRSADASYELASWALRTGRTVVSTNTALLAERGGGLEIASLIGHGTLKASGALRGCPSLAPVLGRSAVWPGVRRVQGSFSPLGDRVLDLRAAGLEEEEAERIAAAELGLSLADIAASRDGRDAMETLGAVAHLAFGEPATVRAMPRGTEHVSDRDLARAALQGRRFRVIATAERVGDQIALRVGPVPLRETDPLVSTVPGAVEATVETRDGSASRASGRLSHPGSVAAAVLRDLIESLRDACPARTAKAGPSEAGLGLDPALGVSA